LWLFEFPHCARMSPESAGPVRFGLAILRTLGMPASKNSHPPTLQILSLTSARRSSATEEKIAAFLKMDPNYGVELEGGLRSSPEIHRL